MPIRPVRTTIDIRNTKFGAGLERSRAVLRRSGLRTLLQLRTAAKNPDELKRRGLDEADVSTIAEFARLARVFPADVAIALQEAGAESVEELKTWQTDRFSAALKKSGLADAIAVYETTRLERLKKLLSSATPAADVRGVTIDLAGTAQLSPDAARKLQNAGVETLDDWAAFRDRAGLDAASTNLLDARCRLATIGVGADLATGLMARRVDSALDLARLSDAEVKSLAALLRVAEQTIAAARQMSQAWIADVAGMLSETKVNLDGPSLDGLDVIGDLVNVEPDTTCIECAPELSAFSRFAYFIYLVRRTGKPLAELEAMLHQNLSALSPDSGREDLRQIEIFNEVMARANATPLSHAERFFYERALLVGKIALIPVAIRDLAREVAQAVPTANAGSIEGRIRDAFSAAATAQEPSFTPAELDALKTAVERRLKDYFYAQVRGEANFAGASAADIEAESNTRLEAALAPVLEAALPLLRDAYKRRSGKTDAELFNTFFIEADLPVCETISRLDQAIRSLQAYLDHSKAMADEQEERQKFSYASYETWRGDKVAETYPEIKALWRDDVFTYENGPLDRGSILFNHSIDKAQLRKALNNAAEAIQDAKAIVAGSNNAVGFRDSHAVFYADFERGFNAIDELLSADDVVQSALEKLDQYEPGQAQARLADGAAHLDGLAQLVFHPASRWITLGSGLDLYHRLASLPPASRKETLQSLFEELITGQKAIFTPRNANIGITGLLDDGTIESLAAWQVDGAFVLQDGGIRKNEASGAAASLKQARYSASAARDFSNYTATADFALRDVIANGDRLGLGARLTLQGSKGYRVLVQREVTQTDPDEGEFVDGLSDFFLGEDNQFITRTVLKIERFDESGSEAIASTFIRPAGTVAVDQEHLPVGENFTLTVQVYGNSIEGTLTIAGEDFHVSAEDDSYASGTFALLAGRNVQADFSNLRLSFEGAEGRPPFYAERRKRLGHRISPRRYVRHRAFRSGMALHGMAAPDLTFPTQENREVKLEGAKVDGKQLLLSFSEGRPSVSLRKLDEAFEKLLASAFYLRYGVIPVRLAQAYEQAGDYAAAAGMLRIVYDDSVDEESEREIYPMLSAAPETFTQSSGADSRLMKLRLGQIYLALAEWHFRQDTPESRYQARRLYQQVLLLHDDSGSCECARQLGELSESVATAALHAGYVDGGRPGLEDALALIDISVNTDVPIGVTQLARSLANGSTSIQEVRAAIDKTVRDFRAKVSERATIPRLTLKGTRLLKEAELRAVTRRNVAVPLTNDPFRGLLPGIGIDVNRLLGIHLIDFTFCVPEAPVKSQHRRIACRMLDLLRSCRNILGFQNAAVPPLRFEALLRGARSFADLAQAAERDLLSFRQQFEQEAFSLLQAENSLEISEAQLALESMNVQLAEGEAKLAGLQFDQANAASSHFEGLLDAGLSSAEELALNSARAASAFSALAAAPALAGVATTIAGAGVTAASGGAAAPAGAVLATAGTILTTLTGGLSSLSAAARDVANAASMQASFERRQQDWEFQLQQSRTATAMAAQNVIQASMRFAIAQQTRRIAGIQRDFAADAVQFLSSKFLNGAMWLFMQRIMRDQYRTRLNYAIAAAFMAERALAFELQNNALRIIRFDYFDPSKDGLLGATQLQTDLATLENTKLSFSDRKQQLSKTMSLAQAMPADFEIFRSGATLDDGTTLPAGRLRFSTPMDMFERDYPGHYMRLIKGIKVSLIALIPPTDGIRAVLRNSGISRVIVGPPYSDTFRAETIRRNPESVALSSPFQATGLFVFDYKDELLLPFEGSGVATDWLFELPKASNRFDYGTVADVLVTIEYTALESDLYRRQVIDRLPRTFSADRAFSFRQEFADQWYDLHNPDLTAPPQQPMVVKFTTRREDFPPNLEDLRIRHVTLYFGRAARSTAEIDISGLRFTEQGQAASAGGAATTANGYASTRENSGASWAAIIGKSPAGEWELALPDTQSMRARFNAGAADGLEDILLVITYSGRTPEWPL